MGTSEITKHAAIDILKYASKSALLRNDYVVLPRLNELSIEGYNTIKNMVHKTFPNVSTVTIYQWQYSIHMLVVEVKSYG